MKKECINCGNFSLFYTKIGFNYFQTKCGRCCANEDVTGYTQTCDKWEAKPVNKEREREELIEALNDAITSLNNIKEKLDEE